MGDPFDDSGRNIPEPIEALRAQQSQLTDGLRPAQMFPVGTPELALPDGYSRIETARGVFHYNPRMVSEEDVRRSSEAQRENEILGLGPFSKAEVFERAQNGETVHVVTERTPDGVEVRAAAGTKTMVPYQKHLFERSKTPGNIIAIEHLLSVLARRLNSAGGVKSNAV